jgi:dihydrodipicolinate synthase/N-acetylneuraminate lyase
MWAMAPHPITGTLAAAITPLRDGGRRLDEEAMAPLIDFYAATGIDGLLVLGTTGEGMLFESDERRRVAELAVQSAAELAVQSAAELAVIVHCGAQTTPQTTARAAHAAEAGADGVAVIGPPYFALTPDELLEHFAAAAAACAPLPFYVYEYADRSGYAIPIEVVRALRERAENLVGMKVSDAPFTHVAPYLIPGLDVFIGAEAVIPEGLAAGAAGAVSGVAAAFPEAVAALVKDPNSERARLVRSLRVALSARPFQASVKAALTLRGVPIRPDLRAPLRPLPPQEVQRLDDELKQLEQVVVARVRDQVRA